MNSGPDIPEPLANALPPVRSRFNDASLPPPFHPLSVNCNTNTHKRVSRSSEQRGRVHVKELVNLRAFMQVFRIQGVILGIFADQVTVDGMAAREIVS